MVDRSHSDEVSGARLPRASGQDRAPVLVVLTLAHRDLVSPEIDVLHPQPRAFPQAEPGAVEKRGHDPAITFEGGETTGDLGAIEGNRQALRALGWHDTFEPCGGLRHRDPHGMMVLRSCVLRHPEDPRSSVPARAVRERASTEGSLRDSESRRRGATLSDQALPKE